MNKYTDHLYVLPEDDANRQIADGFINHHMVDYTRIQIMPPCGGWANVLKTFEDEYVRKLRNNSRTHVVMLIDFDGQVEDRRARFEGGIPEELRDRVFLVGSRENPEELRRQLRTDFERIGLTLADECDSGGAEFWDCEHLRHNGDERRRLGVRDRPFAMRGAG